MLINSNIKVKTGVATLMSSNGEKATTPFQKAESLKTFLIVFSHLKSECAN